MRRQPLLAYSCATAPVLHRLPCSNGLVQLYGQVSALRLRPPGDAARNPGTSSPDAPKTKPRCPPGGHKCLRACTTSPSRSNPPGSEYLTQPQLALARPRVERRVQCAFRFGHDQQGMAPDRCVRVAYAHQAGKQKGTCSPGASGSRFAPAPESANRARKGTLQTLLTKPLFCLCPQVGQSSIATPAETGSLAAHDEHRP